MPHKPTLKPGWKMVKFGDVVKNANLVERDPEAAGIERIVGLEHLDPENLHIRRWNTPENGTSFTRKFVPGQTLFGKRRAYQRKVAYAEFEGICSGDILTFEPKDKKVLLPELLPFICQSDAFFAHALGTSAGSLSPRTSWKALKDFEFPLPPIEEQKRIAEILWAADEAVDAFLNTCACLDSLQATLIDNLIAQNKDIWQFLPLGNLALAKPQYGANAPACEYKEGGYQYIRITDIDSNGVLNPHEKVGIKLPDEKAKKYLLSPGDILFARTGNTVGKVYLHKSQDDNCVYAGYLVRFKLNLKKILPDFLFLYTRSQFYKKWVKNTVRVGAQPNINGREYSTLPILVPPMEQQKMILRQSAKIETIKRKVCRNVSEIRQVAKRLINGEDVLEGVHV